MTQTCPGCGKTTYSVGRCEFCGSPIPHASGEGTPFGEAKSPETVVTDHEKPATSPETVALGGRDRSSSSSSVEEEVLRFARARTSEAPLDPNEKPLPPNFGRYRVLREVGRGAMGVVYLARDDRIARNVAIKTLSLDANLSTEDRKEISARFNREAQAAGKLSHTNIVTVYDVGEEEGTFYIAMEYLEGATLTEITAEGPLSIPQATDVIVQVLSALSYAHGHDVVHRDIKPDNIFLLPDGRVKVVDFGIARITSTSTMTQMGQVMGTPGYMSPEQVKGEPVGPPSDIFSVGVLFYELLTGTAAFRSTSATSIMYKIVHEEPEALHLVNPGVPYNLEAVIARACAKNPSARYSDASPMKEDIESGVAPEMVPSPVSHDGTVLRGKSIAEVVLPVAVVPSLQTYPVASKKKGLILGISGGALALIAIGVVVFLLVSGRGVALKIKSPKAGDAISTPNMEVSLDVNNPGKVGKVELYLDGQKQGTIDKAPFKTEITSGGAGKHELKASAYGVDGALLAEVTESFETAEGAASSGGDYKSEAAHYISTASATDEQIKGYAARINGELSYGYVSAGLLTEAQDLYNRTCALQGGVQGLSPPAEFQDIHSQFLQYCEYLRIRADALVKGCEVFNYRGNHLAEFQRGAAAKNSFEAGWLSFVNNCRARGIPV